MSFFLKSIATKYGQSYTTCYAPYPAHYTRGATKITVIMAVEAGSHTVDANADGSIGNPRRWVYISSDTCNQFVFGDFINTVLSNTEQYPSQHTIDDQRVIIWDNLSVYVNVIQDHQSNNYFIIVGHSTYRPRFAPI